MEDNLFREIRENATLAFLIDVLEENEISFKGSDIQTWNNARAFFDTLPNSSLDKIYASIVLIPEIEEKVTLAEISEALEDLQIDFKKIAMKNWPKARAFLKGLPLEELKGILRLCTSFPIISSKTTLAKVKEVAHTLQIPHLASDFNSWGKVSKWIVGLPEQEYQAVLKEVLVRLIIERCGDMETLRKFVQDQFDPQPSVLKSFDTLREFLKAKTIEDLNELSDDVDIILDEIHAVEEEGEPQSYGTEEKENQKIDEITPDPKILKLQKLLLKSSRIKIDDMAAVLNVTRPTLIDKLVELPDTYAFKIEEDVVIVGKEATQEFINQLDKKFKEWEATSEKV